jgi:hypothetical protein
MAKMPMQARLQHLFAVISGQRFLKKQGLGNEVPFFICPFKPEETVEMERLQRQLINRLDQAGIRVLSINLYDLSVELLKERDIWDQLLEMEASIPKEQLMELLQGLLDPENHLAPAIAARLADTEFDVLFLSGVGEVFPYIRSHNVLNNLQSTAKEKPTLMFFPGDYVHSVETGASLELFARFHDDRYYRAFNIFHCEA